MDERAPLTARERLATLLDLIEAAVRVEGGIEDAISADLRSALREDDTLDIGKISFSPALDEEPELLVGEDEPSRREPWTVDLRADDGSSRSRRAGKDVINAVSVLRREADLAPATWLRGDENGSR